MADKHPHGSEQPEPEGPSNEAAPGGPDEGGDDMAVIERQRLAHDVSELLEKLEDSIEERKQQHRPYDQLADVEKPTGIPSAEWLYDTKLTIHGINEFLLDPLVTALENVAEREPGEVTYEHIGRLVEWVDVMRQSAGDIIENLATIAVLIHEPLVDLAGGYRPDRWDIDSTGAQQALRQWHGLDQVYNVAAAARETA